MSEIFLGTKTRRKTENGERKNIMPKEKAKHELRKALKKTKNGEKSSR